MTLPVIQNCDGCGACCTGQAGLPASYFVGIGGPMGPTASGKSVPKKLRNKLRKIVKGWLANGFPRDGSPCIWYDAITRRCRHYEFRPALCRDLVKVGDEACRRWRKTVGIVQGK